ncbi:hypothetical protein CYMTET_21386 [Cymbomonas tetramitiformis]|uniref:Uncharacterized protein n=1 Tax=Cymbomonas tetramitiformis TaxID=36881 RepID=A0AAE0G2L9_9CHLO|nr:hypothetical protein CYMTET_21386 [Cymbomonas tetramitiformis]
MGESGVQVRAWGEGVRFSAEDDTDKLAKIVTALKNDFDANGLGLEVFDLSDTTREVHPAVNGVLYDTLAHIVAEGSAAEMFLEGAGDASERDGRRALIDLAKGCIPVGLMTSHMEEYMAIRYEAKVDPRMQGVDAGASSGHGEHHAWVVP